jgi:magnesium chelatase family protein
MIATTQSATVLGVEAHPIRVEVDLAVGLSNFTIVGLPDGTIRESRERIVAAVSNSGYSFPVRRITVNLMPAEMRKIGAGFDLPIAAGLLGAWEVFPAAASDGLLCPKVYQKSTNQGGNRRVSTRVYQLFAAVGARVSH